MMSAYDNIVSRRSIRKFKELELPDDIIRKLLMAGMSAPSAMNSQPWEFIVVKDKDMLKQISRISQYWTFVQHASAAVIILANLNNYRASTIDYFIQDCAACTQNILLAANALSLGATWLGLYPNKQKISDFCKLYNLPEHINPFSIIALGFPTEYKQPHDTYNEDKIHFERY